MKKFLFGIAIVLVLLIGALVALPYFFKDEIVAQVKQAANESLNAKMDFQDVDISVFRHFPKLSIGLQGLEITGVEQFDGVKLVQCHQMDLAIDLWSAIFGDKITIKGLYLDQPKINVYVLEDGTANYAIAKPEPPGAPPAAESSPVRLERYAITNGEVHYDDRAMAMRADVLGINHTGSGEFTTDIYDLVTETDVEKLSVRYGGVQYLSDAHVVWKSTLNADMPNMKFTFKENDLQVNALQVLVDGWFQMPNETDYEMNIKFGTPQNTFKSFLSIVPGAYTQDFGSVKADGTVQFGGLVRGKYNETTYPAFKIDLKIANGNVKYPSLPLGISSIFVDMSVNSPSSNLNSMIVDIPRIALRIGSNPIHGRFNLKTPVTNPTVDTKIAGTLNLGELSKAFPMAEVQELSGIIKADILAKASMRQVDEGQYDQVTMQGNFDIQNMNYRAAGQPPVKINALTASLSPQFVAIPNFDARLGKSDIRASGRVDNILAYFSTTKTMTGSLNLRSSYFDANEWVTDDAAAANAGKKPSAAPVATEKVFDRWDFSVDGAIGKLLYGAYTLTDLNLKGNFTPNKMTVENFGMKIGDSDLSGSGQILNAWDFVFDNRTVSGVVNLSSTYFDLNPFMTDAPPTAQNPAPQAVMLVPENVDMTLNANFAKVRYTNMDLQNVDGQIVVNNGVAALRDCVAEVLGGQIALAGAYSTYEPAKPSFDLNMALLNIGFRDAFQNFATVKAMAPIAQFLDGKFSAKFATSGLLGKDMMPDLGTLAAAGFLETINAVVNNFKPMNDIASKLNLSYLNRLELPNSTNAFEIKDGKVTLSPFNAQVRDVSMQIGGSHSLNSEMNYQILTKTPRKALEKTALGNAANSGLRWISGEASKFGVNVAQGEYINIRFDVTGTMTKPKVGFKILPSDGDKTIKEEATATAAATINQAKDTLRNIATQKVEAAKQQAEATAQKAIDTVKNVVNQKVEEAKDKAVQEVGKAVGDDAAKKAEEIIKKNKAAEEAKKKLDEWNPLKKKN
ncbi:MAG: AsmA-like C-terminal region-containing protein [Saprospiraceae bacterium]